MFKYIGDIIKGTGTQLRSLVMVFGHGFRKRDTLQYPEEAGLPATALPWPHRSDPRPRWRRALRSLQPVRRGLPGGLHLAAES